MALSPHFGLFILNCFIVYLPLVVYDVHECFYFHFPLYFKFQARLPDQNFILAANYCHMLFLFIQMFYCVLGTCVILIVHMFPKLRIQWGQKVFCVSLRFSQGQNVFSLIFFSGPLCKCFCTPGGFEVNWGNKSCKYVHKYFFVFLSTQFLSIVFLSTAKSLQVHCKPQTI